MLTNPAELAVRLTNMTDWTALNPTGPSSATGVVPSITGGFNIDISAYTAGSITAAATLSPSG
jgi:hypothetical protein